MVICIIVILLFLTGGRATPIILLISSIWIIKDKLNRKQIILSFISLIMVLNISTIIRSIRDIPDKNLNNIINVIIEEKETKNSNTIIKIASEMGGSMSPLIETMNLIPNQYDYKYGKSYLASIVAVVPSALIGGQSMTNEANLAEWLMGALKLDYGPGYSLVAEAYYNYGWIGLPFIIILGIFYSKMLNYRLTNIEIINNLNRGIIAIFMYISIAGTRDSVYLLIRNSFYLILIPKILIYIMYKYLNKKLI